MSSLKRSPLILCFSMVLSFPALAQQAVVIEKDNPNEPVSFVPLADSNQTMVSVQAAAAKVEPTPSYTERLDDLVTAYELGEGRVFLEKAERGELFYALGRETIMAKPEDRNWGNYRSLAYQAALQNARAEYIEWLNKTTTASTATQLFDNAGQMPEFTLDEIGSRNKISEVLNKALAVTSGKLDAQLMEMGIDAEEFKAASEEKRATLFRDAITTRVRTRAIGDLSGIIPVKTFEAFDEKGNHEVAVAIVASERMRQFVADVTRSKGDFVPEPNRAGDLTLMERLRTNKGALLDDFGIRKMYDQEGYPVLVSFGQSSNPYRDGSSRQAANGRKVSFEHAKAQASANFAYLFKSSGVSSSIASQSAEEKNIGVARLEGVDQLLSEESTMSFLATLDKTINTQGSVKNMAGTRELFRWTAKHPMYGHEINGVVYIWHPRAEQQARALKNFTPKKKVAATAVKPVVEQGTAGVSQSRSLMSADDF